MNNASDLEPIWRDIALERGMIFRETEELLRFDIGIKRGNYVLRGHSRLDLEFVRRPEFHNRLSSEGTE